MRRAGILVLALALAACNAPPDLPKEPPPRAVAPAPAVPPIAAVVPPTIRKGAPSSLPSTYDRQIKAAVTRYGCAPDWHLWWGQLFQESRMDPDARSPAGAVGLAQFMPGTWDDMMASMARGTASRTDADESIERGCYYMARLRRSWSSPRPEVDRHDLAMASYNAGIGHILNAQRACGGPLLYAPIMACLPQITGPVHSRETLGYAPAIRRHAIRKAGS